MKMVVVGKKGGETGVEVVVGVVEIGVGLDVLRLNRSLYGRMKTVVVVGDENADDDNLVVDNAAGRTGYCCCVWVAARGCSVVVAVDSDCVFDVRLKASFEASQRRSLYRVFVIF
jgi:hypothetical protein